MSGHKPEASRFDALAVVLLQGKMQPVASEPA